MRTLSFIMPSNLSSAKPEIATYPFTTKQIIVGHIKRKEKFTTKTYQIIDTPGLLDRPIEKRNDIEKQAIAALTHLANIIVFLIDPSETCGYTLEHQYNMLHQIRELFHNVSIVVVENKVDLKRSNSKELKISCETKEGMRELRDELFKILNTS